MPPQICPYYKVLTIPTPAPSQPKVSTPSSSSATSSESSKSPNETDSAVATNSTPPTPEASSKSAEAIVCTNNCEPEYPNELAGVEGSAGVKLTIDRDGNVIGAELATIDGNSKVNRQALLAARQMQFSSPGDKPISVRVKIDFTVEGSEYDLARREEHKRREQAKREQAKKEQEETARQEQLEAKQQARKKQQQQESAPPPSPEAKPAPKPLPTLSPEELNEEKLRNFQERMDNYQQE